MLIPKNNANQMRTRILIKIAESYFADKFKNAEPLLHLQGPRGLKIPLHVQPWLFAGRRNR